MGHKNPQVQDIFRGGSSQVIIIFRVLNLGYLREIFTIILEIILSTENISRNSDLKNNQRAWCLGTQVKLVNLYMTQLGVPDSNA